MVAVEPRAACARIGVSVPNDEETREGILKYPYPVLGFKPGERCVNNDPICAHDGAGLLGSRRIDVDGAWCGWECEPLPPPT
jgi:hypothetical protein